MSRESDKAEELSSSTLGSEQRRLSSGGNTTTTEKESIDEPISPAAESPPPVDARDEKEVQDGGALDAVRSVTSSMRSRHANPVPKESRRGLLPWLSLTPEVDNPTHYNNSLKWVLTLFVAIAASAAPMGSSILYPSLEEIAGEFHVSATVVNLSVAVYLISMSVFPLWWSSFSETLGRRSIYLVSFALNVIFTAASGVSQNIAQLIVFRTFAGGAAASVQAVGAGTIADLWESRERGRAMGLFYLGPLCGPLLAPIIGGALTSSYGWRSTMYFLAVYGAVIFALILFGIPETLPRHLQEQKAAAAAAATSEDANTTLSRVSTRRSAVHARTKTVGLWMKRVFVDPLSILKLMRFPAVALTVGYAAITFGSLFVLNICVESGFSAPPYNFSALITGLLYIPSSVGYVIASLLGGPWLDRIMERSARKAGRYDARGRLIYYPEDRVRENAWISSTLYPGALIWFGWTLQTQQHWIVPSVANFFFGVGSMLVFSMATTMLTEFMPKRASSGVALNNFVRNILSATGTVVTRPLVEAIGFGWLTTAVALIAWIGGSIALFLIRRNSQKWRREMNEKMS
ncbi:major facilitator superfamily domain-containing protein [Xylaria bambusicola]|uniref:major facilitator superfamily domain-containing protein n=1 Tax=Xylaria bambusicola TaxID=326684 RepID=UPI0020075B78|nr:major facilitator superfamily domain-containing protein [Xylaria bambusicola]KAI0528191.1 major facilitator superfamily domain-containing protein [Xylaria bambusicola]